MPSPSRRSFTRTAPLTLTALLASMLLVGTAHATTSTWLGGAGLWNDPVKWDTDPNYPCNGVGGDTYDAIVPSGTLDLNLDCDYELNLHQALVALQVPSGGASTEIWQAFADELRSIMITHRNIGHEWNFTQKQIKRLIDYFQANRLLVECLNLAYVSDRAAIEDSLLLPPEI